jgi:hypothetical protein
MTFLVKLTPPTAAERSEVQPALLAMLLGLVIANIEAIVMMYLKQLHAYRHRAKLFIILYTVTQWHKLEWVA